MSNNFLRLLPEDDDERAACSRCRDRGIERQVEQEQRSHNSELGFLPPYQLGLYRELRSNPLQSTAQGPGVNPRQGNSLERPNGEYGGLQDLNDLHDALPPEYDYVEYNGWENHLTDEYFPFSNVHQRWNNHLEGVIARGAPQELLSGTMPHNFIRRPEPSTVGRDSSHEHPAGGMLQNYLNDRNDYFTGITRRERRRNFHSILDLPAGYPARDIYLSSDSYYSLSPTVSNQSGD